MTKFAGIFRRGYNFRDPNRTIYVGAASSGHAARRLLFDQSEPPPAERFQENVIVTSKYTIWNFIPKNLFEQFRRIANFYFLCIAIVQLSTDSPVSPVASVSPLVFVVLVTAGKQGYEDWLRHRADEEVNNRPARVIRGGQLVDIKAREITVGDIVKIERDKVISSDMVLLSSSNADGVCHVTTVNLDGETNLKTYQSPTETSTSFRDIISLAELVGVVECEQPTPDLYNFIGRMTFLHDGVRTTHSLNAAHLLLRGSRLKDTDFIFGCAVYTGKDTKMIKNSNIKSNKFSTAERSMNKFLFFLLSYLAVEAGLSTLVQYYIKYDWSPVSDNNFLPLRLPPQTAFKSFIRIFSNFLAFVVIYNYIIPISLYVTLEMQKFLGAMFFKWDVDMYDAENELSARVNTSDINEELGQIEYLFSDKTGTLTENEMIFRDCSINGERYREEDGALVHKGSREILQSYEGKIFRFVMNLVLNHSVRVSHSTASVDMADIASASASASASGVSPTFPMNSRPTDRPTNGRRVSFKASSPDEKAFLEAARRFGVVYAGVTEEGFIRIVISGQELLFQNLHTLDFDADRKCMSIIVRDLKSGKIFLMCKGAESSLRDKLTSGCVHSTYEDLEEFAIAGLRTLVFGERELSAKEFVQIDEDLSAAKNALEDRNKKLSEAYDRIEKNLECLGATGVEDLLQDNVRETLTSLEQAGMKIWVLTGDKKETGVNISYSCGHFLPNMRRHELTDLQLDAIPYQLDQVAAIIESLPDEQHCLVVDGKTIGYVLKGRLRSTFAHICGASTAVLACRLSPLQKAEVVAMVKDFPGSPICAAIGDGANDVSMIQEAHVGIGIMGKEGRQAVRCSDFAFSKFKFLKKAILVHGHWYYVRVSVLTMYFFYKNLAYCTPQLFFAVASAFSSQTLFESAFLMMYNIAFTAIPILVFGLFEQNISKDTLLENPQLYRTISKNALMTPFKFFSWLALGYYQSIINFYGSRYLVQTGSLNGAAWAIFSNWDIGFMTFTSCVLVVNLKLFTMTRFWCASTKIVYFGTLFFFLIFSLLYCGVSLSFITSHHYMYLVFYQVFSLLSVWACLLVQVALALLPDAAVLAYRSMTSHLAEGERPFEKAWRKLVHFCCCCCRYIGTSKILGCRRRRRELPGTESNAGVETDGCGDAAESGRNGERRRVREECEKEEEATASSVIQSSSFVLCSSDSLAN